MKTLETLLILALLFIGSDAFAQLGELGLADKKFYIDGTLSFGKNENDRASYQNTYLNISPNIGYFISKNIVLGGGLGIGFNSYKFFLNTNPSAPLYRQQRLIAPRVFMKYLKPINDRIIVGLGTFAGYGQSKTKENQQEIAKTKTTQAGITLEAQLLITKSIGIKASTPVFNFSHQKLDWRNEISSDYTFTLNLHLLDLGIFAYLGKK